MPYRRSRFSFLAMLLLAATPAAAQQAFRSVAEALRDAARTATIRFDTPPAPAFASPATFWYRIPPDSVRGVAYSARSLSPAEPWLRTPAFVLHNNRTPDSFFASSAVAPGYYLAVSAQQGTLNFYIRRKAAFIHAFVDLRDVRLLTLAAPDDADAAIRNAEVTLGKKSIRYNDSLGGYPLPARAGTDTLGILYGGDALMLQYSYTAQPRAIRPNYRAAETPDWSAQTFEGYLVTSQPTYRRGDTLRYKAYLLDPATRKPATEPVEVSFTSPYYPYKKVVVHPRLMPSAPGVYFSEAVIGDSVQSSVTYSLRMERAGEIQSDTRSGTVYQTPVGYGSAESSGRTRVATSIQQPFRVEDYELQNIFLKLAREDVPVYQPGDSLLFWAHAYDASKLPLTDGTLTLSIVPEVHYHFAPDTVFSVPDTLYRAVIPVDESGETRIAISTAGWPRVPMNLRGHLRLQSAAAEVHDTTIYLPYVLESHYLTARVEGDSLYADMMRGKRSVSGAGSLYIDFTSGAGKTQRVRFPYRAALPAGTRTAYFTTDSLDGSTSTAHVSVPTENPLRLEGSYDRDTAFLYIKNSRRVLLRYAWYRGSVLGGIGHTRSSDTTLRFRTTGGETVTLLSHHRWMGGDVQQRTPIYKWDRNLSIDVDKKGAVFPGATDTVGISLTDADGRPVPRTNLTVLAFNAQMPDDFTPALEYRGLLKPSLPAPSFLASLTEISPVGFNRSMPLVDARWLRLCGLDTAWFYRDVQTATAPLVHVIHPAPDEPRARLAVWLQRADGATYTPPTMVWVDDVPVYFSFAQGVDVAGISVPVGEHRLRLRFQGFEVTLPQNVFERGTAHTIFLKTARRTLHGLYTPKAYSLESAEREVALRHVQAYARENLDYRNAWAGQGPLTVQVHNGGGQTILGPIDPQRALLYYAQGGETVEHFAETGYILSFRGNTLRMQDARGTLLQGIGLYDNWQWRLFATPTRVAFRLDTLQAVPGADDAPRSPVAGTFREPMLRDWTPTVDEKAPLGWLAIRNRAGLPSRGVMVEGLEESRLRSFRQSGGEYWRLPPGRYRLRMLLQGGYWLSLPDATVRAGHGTYIPVRLDSSRMQRLDYRALPAWAHELIREPDAVLPVRDTVERVWTGDRSFSIDMKGFGEIFGHVRAGLHQGAMGARILILKNARVVDSTTVSELTGAFSIPGLPAAAYTVVVRKEGFKTSIIYGVTVRPDEGSRMNCILPSSGTQGGIPAGTPLDRELDKLDLSDPRHYAYYYNDYDAYDGASGRVFTQNAPPMPSMAPSVSASLSSVEVSAYRKNSALTISGGRGENTLYIVDGIQQVGSRGVANLPQNPGGDLSAEEEKPFLQTAAGRDFIAAFISAPTTGSGIRRHFRDWAIWEPDLWSNDSGKTSFVAHYPDNITSWKTYVLAMNERGFSGRHFSVTRAFKPLSAQLLLPRFLRYGDTLQAVTKVMNYTGQPFSVKTSFRQEKRPVVEDTLTLRTARTAAFPVPAPAHNRADTGRVPLTYTLATPAGFTDGEEREMPVYPVGTVEWRSSTVKVMRDTVFSTGPDAENYSGLARFAADESVLGVLLRDIEALKEYPYGCTEQLTTRLLAISYEEEIKRALGREKDFNNAAVRRTIIRKLAKAQNADGSFGWFGGNAVDYRITNYVLSTMERIGDKRELSGILQQGYAFLARQLMAMPPTEQLTALSTLSAGRHPTAYDALLPRLRDSLHDDWSRFTIARICQEQHIACDSLLNELAATAETDSTGKFLWGRESYDWYRNRSATSILAYRVFSASPRHERLAENILEELIFPKTPPQRYGRSTAESGQLLSAVVPRLLQRGVLRPKAASGITITGGPAPKSITSFPAMVDVEAPAPEFSVAVKPAAPLYLNVSYRYFNPAPTLRSEGFTVRSHFVDGRDTLRDALKSGTRSTLRATVRSSEDAEYVLVEIPVPAGCVPDRRAALPGPYEEFREVFADRVAIFCRYLPAGTWSFDVPLEARYRGVFALNPARAERMYFPEKSGCEVVKRVQVE